MPFWYFLRIPKLLPEVAHQSGTVEIKKYLLREGRPVNAGTPIVLVENYWAIMQFETVGTGVFRKAFFDEGMIVKIGDPIGIVATDGDDLVYDKDNLTVKVIEMIRERPSKIDVALRVMRENEEALRRLAE
jgi:pyruvate/2-oxoglutarate dehydrogenase complex dihydrolipoamide acyltransferase (E2) component